MNDFREKVQKEAVKVALTKSCGLLDITMRLGKTKIGLDLASNFKKVLVSYPNIKIKDSWLSDSIKFSINIDHIEFTTHLSLVKKDLSLYDCIILDEIQDVSENQWNYIALSTYSRLYGLSGTPPNRGEKLLFINNYCPIIYSKKLDETTGKTNKDYEIIVHLLQPSDKKDLLLKSGKYWSEQNKIQFFENKYLATRHFKDMLQLIQTIQNSPTKLNYLKQLTNKLNKCLIFVETAKHCEFLAYPSYQSKEKNSESNLNDFLEGKINKLSTINQLKAGITFEDLNQVVILHCYSSNNKAAQKLARALNYVENEKAIIHILCLDNTRDKKWVEKGLSEFQPNKIKYITDENNI